jgi:hypothetical protein
MIRALTVGWARAETKKAAEGRGTASSLPSSSNAIAWPPRPPRVQLKDKYHKANNIQYRNLPRFVLVYIKTKKMAELGYSPLVCHKKKFCEATKITLNKRVIVH